MQKSKFRVASQIRNNLILGLSTRTLEPKKVSTKKEEEKLKKVSTKKKGREAKKSV